MKGIFIGLIMGVFLSGCGLEMLGSQTAVAKMQKREVDRGRKAHDNAEKKIDKVEEMAAKRDEQMSKTE